VTVLRLMQVGRRKIAEEREEPEPTSGLLSAQRRRD